MKETSSRSPPREHLEACTVSRLGIDAPEAGQGPFGAEARTAADETFVNAEMLRAGFALVDVRPPNVKYVIATGGSPSRTSRRKRW